MDGSAALLVLLDFLAAVLLAPCYFRRFERLGIMWYATSTPFAFGVALLAIAYLLPVAPEVPVGWRAPLALVAVVTGTASIGLLTMALGTHRVAPALWHQHNDRSDHLVTYGAYRLIRHPFYTSYILCFAALMAVFPHWASVLLFVYMTAMLELTASREERRLRQPSAFGDEYTEYMAHTGRFLPTPAAIVRRLRSQGSIEPGAAR